MNEERKKGIFLYKRNLIDSLSFLSLFFLFDVMFVHNLVFFSELCIGLQINTFQKHRSRHARR